MDEKLESVKAACGITPLTEAWDEVTFEELEERLGFENCGKFGCKTY
ncbi:MAG: hypothetical protein ACTTJ7_04675 [Treponema sp.]